MVSFGKAGIKFKMHDKGGALIALAKNLDLFAKDNRKELQMTFGKIKKADAKVIADVFDKITE